MCVRACDSKFIGKSIFSGAILLYLFSCVSEKNDFLVEKIYLKKN